MYGKRVGGGMFSALDFSVSNERKIRSVSASRDSTAREECARIERRFYLAEQVNSREVESDIRDYTWNRCC